MVNPFVLSSNDTFAFQQYIEKYKEEHGILLHYIYFNEEEYYMEKKYMPFTAYFFQYGFRDQDKKPTKAELDYCFWNII